ncbi:MAG: DUF2249 domain-containing protein [Caldilineaceae bacterium]|nr:DUF2249 domain-containing protein [Caldilineaceae bacterium]
MDQEHESLLVIDVRTIPPRDRHPLIFQAFDRLEPSAALILVNDHEPRPLYYQFLHERADQFTWAYLDEGPDIWRVQIGKVAAA